MGDVGTAGTVAERDRLVVDDSHVVGPIMRDAGDGLLGDLSGEQCLELLLLVGRAVRGFRSRSAGGKQAACQQQCDHTHFNLLEAFLCAPPTFYTAPGVMNGSCLCRGAAARTPLRCWRERRGWFHVQVRRSWAK